MIGRTISHYRIVEKLGEGGMGVVYVAEDTVLGRRVAIKTLTARGGDNQHFRARFLREARAVSALSHPNIAAIYDYGQTEEGDPYIVMELIKGETLSDLMHKEKLTIPRAIEIIKQVAEALGEAHSQGIIHRDIKPSNVAINERGNVKVLDFGLAKQLDPGPINVLDPDQRTLLNTQTREGMIIGTPLYLSPEQALGVDVDARSDLFAVGSLLYECITGRPAFNAETPTAICARIMRDDPAPPSEINPDVPEELDEIVQKALAKKPEARFQTAEQMVEDLENARTSLLGLDRTVTRMIAAGDGTHKSTTLATLSDIFRRPRLPIGYVAAALVGVIAVGLLIWWITRPKVHTPRPQAQHLYDLGVDALRASAFFKASKLLQHAIAEDDQFALAHARLAEAWTEMDFSDKAKDELIAANRLVPNRSALSATDQVRFDAITNVVQRDFATAVENYRVLSTQVPITEKAYAFVDLGRAYEKNEQLDKAIESYLEASKRDPNYPTPFLRLGVTYGRRQKFTEAYAAFDQAYKLFDLLSESEGQTEVLLQRGILLGQQNKVDEARVQLEQALQRAAALEHKDKQIRTLLNLSNNYIVAALPAKAEEYSQEALQLAQANGLENLTTAGLIDIGNAQLQRGHFAEADNLFNQALHLAQLYKGKRNEARASLSLASLRSQQNRPEEVLTYCQTALAYYELGGYRQETSLAYLLRGRAYDAMGRYNEAEKDFQQQLQLAQSVNDLSNLGYAHEGLGSVEEHRQNFPAALSHYDEKYKVSQSLRKLSLGHAAVARGSMLAALGRADEARAALSEARSIAENGGKDPYTDLLALVHLASAELLMTELKSAEAIKESETALSLAQPEYNTIAIRAKSIGGLALSLAGQAAAGKKQCEDAVAKARLLKDPYLLSEALLTVSEAALNSNDPQAALDAASEAEQRCAESNQYEFEWRAANIAAIATKKLGDNKKAHDIAARANSILSRLEQVWGGDYLAYINRADIRRLRQQSETLLT
jgi:tetratricopeptide (TPR) repeat protein/predicted Ser/Thr protein kinase